MNIFKSLGLVALSVFAVSTFSSCEEHNPFSEQELFEHEYAKNFFATYGQFPAGQSWDFSDAPRTAPTDPSIFDLGREQGNTSNTRADGDGPELVSLEDAKKSVLRVPEGEAGTANDPYYYLEEATYDWVAKNLPEQVNNTTKGSPFVFNYGETNDPTNQKFAIIPIYQGYGTIHYKMHMVSVDQNKDYVIWDNWPTDCDPTVSGTEDFQHNLDWHNPQYSQSDWAAGTYSGKNKGWQDVHKRDDLKGRAHKDRNFRSKPMIISGLSGEFYFYLEVTSVPSSGYGYVGEHQSSKEGMMLALPCPVPDRINDYKTLFDVSNDISQVMVIGCEDTKYDDWDINDIVFMIVGLTDLPQKREVKHSKRYLIEDLGTTVDFDFNDVVVDVTETVMVDASGNETVYTQEAIIKHLCGTVPFKVYFVDQNDNHDWTTTFNTDDPIQGEVQGLNEECKDEAGNYKYKLIYSKHNKNIVNATKDPFWDPARNNIRIDVGSSETLHGESWSNSAQIKTGHFNKPNEATAPYIIAVPTTVMWTAESVNFPINNFVVLPDTEKGQEHPSGN